MNVWKTLGQQGLLVAIAVLGLAGAASAGPKSIGSCKTIDEPGSYLVTKNLTATGDCLVVAAPNITLDIGGHVLSGAGWGKGIWVLPAGRGAVIRNGTLTEFGGGILAGANATVDQISVYDGANYGIYVAAGSTVRNSMASNNVMYGLRLQCPSSAIGNVVTDNVDTNLITNGAGCVLSQNVAP
jgi:hypothetical protein